MKKMVSILLVSLLVVCFTGSAFAMQLGVQPGEVYGENLSDKGSKRFEILKEFKDEIHEINALRIQRHSLQIKVIERRDKILDLYIEARENGNKGALKEAGEVRKEIKVLNEEIRGLIEQIAEERKAFKEDAKEGSYDAARGHAESVISLLEQVNGKIEEKIELLDQIIDILS